MFYGTAWNNLLQFHAYEHLPDHLQTVSKPFGDLARELAKIGAGQQEHAGSSRPSWVKLRRRDLPPGNQLCLQERTSSVPLVSSEKCQDQKSLA
jgi:hypothetical protein